VDQRRLGQGRMMTPAERFGLLLLRRRLLAEMPQAALADLLDVHRTEISLYERGGREPRLDALLSLAAAVEADPAELVMGIRWIPGIYDLSGGYNRKQVGRVDRD
jgi:transcriptional regulator with XRE-family HTH domain